MEVWQHPEPEQGFPSDMYFTSSVHKERQAAPYVNSSLVIQAYVSQPITVNTFRVSDNVKGPDPRVKDWVIVCPAPSFVVAGESSV